MTSETVRVLLVLPTARTDQFGTGRYTIGWQARNALRVAARVSGAAGVDVLLYGLPADGGYEEDGVVVRTRVEPESLAEWTGEWAVLSDGGGPGFPDDRRPPSRVERTFAAGRGWHSPHRAAVREVLAALKEGPGPKLVLFQLDSTLDREELVLAIRDAGEDAAFWQLFGRERALGPTFWSEDGLHRGRVLPQLAVYFDTDVSHRAVARRFRRWRKRTGT